MTEFVESCGKEKKPADIRYAAIKLLVRREQSMSELSTKLTRKFSGSESHIEQELEKLAEEGLQSDLRYAEMVVRSGINKYHGPLRIKAELRQKKVNDSIIEKAFAEEDADWSKLIVALDKKKYGSAPMPKEPKDVAKRLRFFQSKAYNAEYIDVVLGDPLAGHS